MRPKSGNNGEDARSTIADSRVASPGHRTNSSPADNIANA